MVPPLCASALSQDKALLPKTGMLFVFVVLNYVTIAGQLEAREIAARSEQRHPGAVSDSNARHCCWRSSLHSLCPRSARRILPSPLWLCVRYLHILHFAAKLEEAETRSMMTS